MIPSSINSNGNLAFNKYKCSIFKLPSSLTLLGENMFKECSSLKIKEFINCHSLIKISIPSSLISIGEDAFYFKNRNKNSSVKSISKNFFYRCSSLKKIKIPSFVDSIADDEFDKCTSF